MPYEPGAVSVVESKYSVMFSRFQTQLYILISIYKNGNTVGNSHSLTVAVNFCIGHVQPRGDLRDINKAGVTESMLILLIKEMAVYCLHNRSPRVAGFTIVVSCPCIFLNMCLRGGKCDFHTFQDFFSGSGKTTFYRKKNTL